MLDRLFMAALYFVVGSQLAEAAGPLRSFKVDNWTGGSYTNDKTKLFSHCAASVTYKSGITMLVAVSRDFSWSLGFAHNSWQLTPNQQVAIGLNFDGRGRTIVNGTAADRTFVVVPMPDNSQLISDFRRAYVMIAYSQGHEFKFNLDATSRLLPALVDCVRYYMPQNPPATPAITSTLNPSGEELHTEALELTSNFLVAGQIQGAKITKVADAGVSYGGANWSSSSSWGAVRVIPGDATLKGIDLAATVVAADARECKGKFASGRTSELVDSDVVFRGFSSCDDSAGVRVSQYFIVPRRKGGFAIFSVVARQLGSEIAPEHRDERVTMFRKAALSAAAPH